MCPSSGVVIADDVPELRRRRLGWVVRDLHLHGLRCAVEALMTKGKPIRTKQDAAEALGRWIRDPNTDPRDIDRVIKQLAEERTRLREQQIHELEGD